MHENHINFVAFDFETATYNRMPCQLGLAIVQNGIIVDQKEYLFRPPNNVYDTNCIKTHKITPDITENLFDFSHYWEEIKTYFDHTVAVAHNIGFDTSVLTAACEHYNLELPKPKAFACTMSIFNNRSLKDVCMALDITLHNHHNAIADALACAEAFIHYLNGVNPNSLSYPERVQRNRNRFLNIEPSLEQILAVEKTECFSGITTFEVDFFANKNFVVSGYFYKYPNRDKLKKIITELGGVNKSGITKSTNYFIAGDEFGPSKMDKVMTLNDQGLDIKIINEKMLYRILEQITKKENG